MARVIDEHAVIRSRLLAHLIQGVDNVALRRLLVQQEFDVGGIKAIPLRQHGPHSLHVRDRPVQIIGVVIRINANEHGPVDALDRHTHWLRGRSQAAVFLGLVLGPYHPEAPVRGPELPAGSVHSQPHHQD